MPEVLEHWDTESGLLEIIFADGNRAAISLLPGRRGFCLELRRGGKRLAHVMGRMDKGGSLTFRARGQAYAPYLQAALNVAEQYGDYWRNPAGERALTDAVRDPGRLQRAMDAAPGGGGVMFMPQD